MSERLLDFHLFEGLDEVSFADVVVALDGESAVVAGDNFLDIVLESFERSEEHTSELQSPR